MENNNDIESILQIKYGFTTKQLIDEGRVTREDINSIKCSLKDEKLPRLTEEQIVLFLLSCANDQEATRRTIKAFYCERKCSSELFDNRKMEREDYKKQLRTGRFCILPQRTDDDCVIILYRFQDTHYYNFDLGPFLALAFMSVDAALYDYPPKGLILLYDTKGMGLMHLTRVRPGYLRSYFNYLQEGLPIKLKNIHVFNSVYFLDKLLKLIRPFAKPQVLELIHFHPSSLNMDLFYKMWIPKKCLPEDYGGDLPSVEDLHQKHIQKLTELQSHFDAEEFQRHNVDC